MRILLNCDIEDTIAGTYFTPECKKDGLYIGTTLLKRTDYEEVPDSVPFEDAMYIECEVDCDEDIFNLSVMMIENEHGRDYHNSMKMQFIEYEPAERKIKELEAALASKTAELAQVIKIGVEGQREINRKLTVEINNAKEALRPLYNIPIQDFDYFEKPSHVLNSWVGKSGTYGLTVQHVIDARKVINGTATKNSGD